MVYNPMATSCGLNQTLRAVFLTPTLMQDICFFFFFFTFSFPVSASFARWLQPDAAAALWLDLACRSWPSSAPAEWPWVGVEQRAAPSSTWPGRGRPKRTSCPRLGASPAGRCYDGDAGRAPAGLCPPPKAPQKAREEESLAGNLVGGQSVDGRERLRMCLKNFLVH